MKKKKILIFSIISALAILAALGTSYALFRHKILDGDKFKIITGNLLLTIDDTTQNNNFTDGKIIINNLIPTKDTDGMTQEGYKFRLTNTGSINAFYAIYLDDVIIESLPTGITGRIDNNLIKINLTNLTTNTSNIYSMSDLQNGALETGTLNVNGYNDYVLKIWLDYNAGNEAQNKYFAAKIRIDGTQSNEMNELNANNTVVNSNYTSCNNMQCVIDELADIYN